ncbi:MAG: hypothetical protein WAN47_11345 [Nitrosotalea sp.]
MAYTKPVILFGIIVVAAVAGIVWPVFINLHLNTAPINASRWHIGKGSQYYPSMIYMVDYNGTKFHTDVDFQPKNDSKQTMLVSIKPDNGTDPISQTIPIGNVYFFTNVTQKAKPYFDMLDNTIFAMNWYATSDKYLANGASWGDVYIGSLHKHMRVRDCTKTALPFGTLETYVLSYMEPNGKNNTVWIADNLPLPVKAQYYYPDQNLGYSYELISLKDPLTHLLACQS